MMNVYVRRFYLEKLGIEEMEEVRGDVGRTVYRCRVLTSVYHFCPLIYALRKPKFSSFFTLILVNNPKNEMAIGCIHSI